MILLEKIIPDPDPIRRELNQEHIQDLIESFNMILLTAICCLPNESIRD